MNILVLYASKKMFAPSINNWPDMKEAYPFAEFLYNYGWSYRPTMVMASRVDAWTNLEELGKRICFDFSITATELNKLQVAGEKGGQLVAFNTFAEYKAGANAGVDSLVIQAPDGLSWYVLVFAKKWMTDYV
jgi:hypothetical protein